MIKTTLKTFEFTKIIGQENINFGDYIIIDDFVLLYAKSFVHIGNYVHIASFTSITAVEKLFIGDFVAISQGCRILTASDDFKNHGFGNSTIDDKYRNIQSKEIKINNFCIIGANSVILPGVTLGEGCSIGANSVITKNTEPWSIYIGNKKIGERNKKAILQNYLTFQENSISDKMGNLFK